MYQPCLYFALSACFLSVFLDVECWCLSFGACLCSKQVGCRTRRRPLWRDRWPAPVERPTWLLETVTGTRACLPARRTARLVRSNALSVVYVCCKCNKGNAYFLRHWSCVLQFLTKPGLFISRPLLNFVEFFPNQVSTAILIPIISKMPVPHDDKSQICVQPYWVSAQFNVVIQTCSRPNPVMTRSSATAEKQRVGCACLPRLTNWSRNAQNTAESLYYFWHSNALIQEVLSENGSCHEIAT